MTLAELLDTYGANGVVMDDAGNGCGGPSWIPLDEITDIQKNIEMYPLTEGTATHADASMVGRLVTDDQRYSVMYVSDWITPESHTADNPYRYRIIF